MTLAHGEFWGQHGTHALLLAGPILFLAAVAVGADLRAWLRTTERRPSAAILVAVAGSLAAAVVHAAVCPEHFEEATLYGVFFAVSAVAQVGWPLLVLTRPRRWLLVAGLVGNLAVIVLWVVTRTSGIPLGPEAGVVEEVGSLDVASAAFELAVVAGCGWSLLRARTTLAAQPAA